MFQTDKCQELNCVDGLMIRCPRCLEELCFKHFSSELISPELVSSSHFSIRFNLKKLFRVFSSCLKMTRIRDLLFSNTCAHESSLNDHATKRVHCLQRMNEKRKKHLLPMFLSRPIQCVFLQRCHKNTHPSEAFLCSINLSYGPNMSSRAAYQLMMFFVSVFLVFPLLISAGRMLGRTF